MIAIIFLAGWLMTILSAWYLYETMLVFEQDPIGSFFPIVLGSTFLAIGITMQLMVYWVLKSVYGRGDDR